MLFAVASHSRAETSVDRHMQSRPYRNIRRCSGKKSRYKVWLCLVCVVHCLLDSSTHTSGRKTYRPMSLKKVSAERLFVSEPDPRMFGNGRNEPDKVGWNNRNWLKSRFHFSFAEYSNRQNTNFGVLRVLNDDLVQPRRGFGTHGHQNAEIVTYIVDGKSLKSSENMTMWTMCMRTDL